MNFLIRPAVAQDYPAIVAIGRSATKDYVQSVADLHVAEQKFVAERGYEHFVATTADGQLISTAYYIRAEPGAQPRHFAIWLYVPVQHQGAGIGKALYARLLTALAPFQPIRLATGVRSDLPRAMRFLLDRGFTITQRECETHFDLTTFAPTRFQADWQRVADQGIVIQTLAELAADPQRDEKLYHLHQQRIRTGMEEGELPPFQAWQRGFWQTPRLLPAGFCVAVDGDTYVGQSNALASGVATELEYGYTGVLPAYRNRGIARAMKLHVLRWAETAGYTVARSFSDSDNQPMQRVNQYLGGVVQPTVYWLEKTMEPQPWQPFS